MLSLRNWKPIHLCWWFRKHNLPIPPLFIGGPAVPVLNQVHWKIGDNDSADPDTCSFDAIDTTRTGQAKTTPFMVRIQVTNTGDAGGSQAWELYYNSSDTTTGAVQVGAALGANVLVDSVGGQPTDGANCDGSTVVYDYSGSYTWQNGEYDEGDGATDKLALGADYYTDFQFSVQFTADAAYSTTYYFFLYFNGGVLDNYSSSAKVATEAAPAGLDIPIAMYHYMHH